MLDWNHFKSLAAKEIDELAHPDDQLAKIINCADVPPGTTDGIGSPMAGSATISIHPDIEGFTRALSIRKGIAEDSRSTAYVYYAEGILKFLRSLPPMSEVHVILVATRTSSYEFFFTPVSSGIFLSDVGTLKS